MRGRSIRWPALVCFVISLSLSGCFLVAAGAGAGAAVAYTSRGAKSTVDGTIDQTFDRAVNAFQQLSITETGRNTQESGAKRQLVGNTSGGLTVTVDMERKTSTTTDVEVIAKKNTVDYDKDFANSVLSKIVQR
jgi:hypothetical protein